jgi:hypothetical protein
MKLNPGDKVWVTRGDGSEKTGWAEWDGECWLAPCSVPYYVGELSKYLSPYSYGHLDEMGRPNWMHMAEQLIAEGAMK